MAAALLFVVSTRRRPHSSFRRLGDDQRGKRAVRPESTAPNGEYTKLKRDGRLIMAGRFSVERQVMRMGFMRVNLLLHASHSLKEKRRPIKSLMEKLRNRFHVSVAEVDAQDLHQRAVLGLAFVAADGGVLAREMNAVKEFVYNNPDCQVLAIEDETIGWRET